MHRERMSRSVGVPRGNKNLASKNKHGAIWCVFTPMHNVTLHTRQESVSSYAQTNAASLAQASNYSHNNNSSDNNNMGALPGRLSSV